MAFNVPSWIVEGSQGSLIVKANGPFWRNDTIVLVCHGIYFIYEYIRILYSINLNNVVFLNGPFGRLCAGLRGFMC